MENPSLEVIQNVCLRILYRRCIVQSAIQPFKKAIYNIYCNLFNANVSYVHNFFWFLLIFMKGLDNSFKSYATRCTLGFS